MRRVDRAALDALVRRVAELEARQPVDRPEDRAAFWAAVSTLPMGPEARAAAEFAAARADAMLPPDRWPEVLDDATREPG